jgi:hypothetical protein
MITWRKNSVILDFDDTSLYNEKEDRVNEQ